MDIDTTPAEPTTVYVNAPELLDVGYAGVNAASPNTLAGTVKLDKAFESAHPYKENSKIKSVFRFSGAKYIRVKVAKFDLESGYDYVRIANGAGTTLEKVSGTGINYTTDYVEGDTVELNFISDRSINKWGYKILEVEVQ